MREMKDSGIDIIGSIPKEWKLKRLRYLCDISTGNQDTQDADPDGLYDFYVRSPIIEKSNKVSFEGEGILMAGDGAGAGRIFHYAIGRYAVHQRVYIVHNIRNIKSLFLYYYLSSIFPKFIDKGSAQSTVPSVRLPMLLNFTLSLPNLKEQNSIVEYVRAKCLEIDTIADGIQKQIVILEDYKKSLVYSVVSKGISNDSRSNHKDEFWGNLPTSWELEDIKYIFEIVKRIACKEGFDVLAVTQKGIKVKDISTNGGQLADNYSGYQFVYPTDYVMNHMDLLTGWVDCSTMFGVTSPDYRVFRLRDKTKNSLSYFKHVMQCCYMNRIFYSLGQGVSNLGRWRLQTSSFNNFKVPVPPKEEQDEIANYLDEKTVEIDSLISDKKKQLERLADYKKSLIYEYVTGKKEVPEQA